MSSRQRAGRVRRASQGSRARAGRVADPRYIKVVDDARSELVIPLLLKDRCLGVFDLESPELDAFNKTPRRDSDPPREPGGRRDRERTAVRDDPCDNEIRLEKEIRFAQRVQAALLPTELPKRMKGVDVAARFAPARELGGDLYDFLAPEPNTLIVAVGDVSGKGVPAALYSAFAGELVRSRTFRRRFTAERSSPAGVLASMNTILHERQLGDYYCTLCYALFDFKRRTVTIANSGLPYPIRSVSKDGADGPSAPAQIELAGIPLGSFPGSSYDEAAFALSSGDLFVFFTDGVFEAAGPPAAGIRDRAAPAGDRGIAGEDGARDLVDAIFAAVQDFRGETTPNDDMTAVAIKITG